MTDNLTEIRRRRTWLRAADCDIEAFARQQSRTTEATDYPLAGEIAGNVPVYDGDAIRAAAAEPEARQALLAEWSEAMLNGPGIVAFRDTFTDLAVIDAATARFDEMIVAEREAGQVAADHFAKAGANDRVWNALQKLCLRDPGLFAAYYGNEAIALVSRAWLGPAWQVTSQVNCVNPGGAAQSAHRDYHLGFQSSSEIERYPAHVHRLSPLLTLQGAVAHCDMPPESGPTLYLPYSQSYEPGYLATGRPEFRAYFEAHHVQLQLRKGDAVFFNPALFHAAGHNRSRDIRRMANLLQVSSAFGRAMEAVDRTRMSRALFPVLVSLRAEGRLSETQAANAIAACAEGYAFPTNLDRDPPIGGLAPESQAGLMLRALAQGWEPDAFDKAIDRQARNRLT
ncbi:phytanoyl-CoA dioxygenase family protein [Lichenicoccus sp.]|uniref:phytanoyl-CoA dioxygenase family protein n=1 Tax=Lichenicoccus sp. TaxID=2781899 RepID=UPI003D11FEDF